LDQRPRDRRRSRPRGSGRRPRAKTFQGGAWGGTRAVERPERGSGGPLTNWRVTPRTASLLAGPPDHVGAYRRAGSSTASNPPERRNPSPWLVVGPVLAGRKATFRSFSSEPCPQGHGDGWAGEGPRPSRHAVARGQADGDGLRLKSLGRRFWLAATGPQSTSGRLFRNWGHPGRQAWEDHPRLPARSVGARRIRVCREKTTRTR